MGDAHPGEVAAALRRAAARVEALEGNLSEFGRALQLTHMLSGQVLQGFGGLSGDATQARSPVGGGGGREEEAPRSFLVKKGDAELQEEHRKAAAMRPSGLTRQTSGGSSSNGGALSTASTPMTKDEMDKARKARLEMLEAQQAEKKREIEEGESKSRAREAMFNPIQPGPSKPLGKF